MDASVVKPTTPTEEDLELAQIIFELLQMGMIREVVDSRGTPRFEPTGKAVEEVEIISRNDDPVDDSRFYG